MNSLPVPARPCINRGEASRKTASRIVGVCLVIFAILMPITAMISTTAAQGFIRLQAAPTSPAGAAAQFIHERDESAGERSGSIITGSGDLIHHISVWPKTQVLQFGTSVEFTIRAYNNYSCPISAQYSYDISDPALGDIYVLGNGQIRFVASFTKGEGYIIINASYLSEHCCAIANVRVIPDTPGLDAVTISPNFWIGKPGAKKVFTAHGWNGTYEVNIDKCTWALFPNDAGYLQVTGDFTAEVTAQKPGTTHLTARAFFNGTEVEGNATIYITDPTGAGINDSESMDGSIILGIGAAATLTAVLCSLLFIYFFRRKSKERERMLREWSSTLSMMKQRKCPRCQNLIPIGMSMCPVCITTPVKKDAIIDEIFLLYNDGRLIKHHTRRIRPALDEKIFSSMLVAVQNFVKDSYGLEEGLLEEMKFGDYRILIGMGRYVILATVIAGGGDLDKLKNQIRKAINELENAYQEILIRWDGNIDALAGVNRFIEYLLLGNY